MRVTEIRQLTDRIRALRLARVDGEPIPSFRGGAHVDLASSAGIARQYSICSPPGDRESIVVAIKLEEQSRGGSAAMHAVVEGEVLEMTGPRNLWSLETAASRHVLVAGGIGLTPVLSMAYEASALGEPFVLHYFARSREDAAFLEVLETDPALARAVHAHLGIDRDEQAEVLSAIAASAAPGEHVYACGPVGFMAAVESAVVPVVGADAFHVEHFVPIDADHGEASAFTVELDTGETYEVPADRSIISVLEEQGIQVFKSCEEGVCGSCISGVIDGVPDHRDSCLTAAERAAGDRVAICVSRALTPRLVIELY